jgi:RimJ/RimL family protein N-acetyltransferase
MRWGRRAHRLEGPRIELRRFCVADAPRLYAAVEDSRSHLERWLRWPRALTDIAAVERWLRLLDDGEANLPFSMGVFRASDDALVGAAGLKRGRDRPETVAEIGYWLTRSALRQGYCTEAVRVLVAHALTELGATRVEVRVDPNNLASVRVCERAGLRKCGERAPCGDDPRPMAIYAIDAW